MTNLKKWKKQILEEHFFRPRWYSVFINPYFISRHSLYVNIRDFADTLKSGQKILDIGCGLMPYQNLFSRHDYIGIDIDTGYRDADDKRTNIFFDGEIVPFGHDEFDVIICTEVLEHAKNPEKLVEESARVLKKEGQFYVTTPFVWNEHEVPYDFRRFTRFELKRMLDKYGFDIKSIRETSGIFGAISQLTSAFLFESLPTGTLLKTLLSILILTPILTIGITLDRIFHKPWISLGYITIATKK